MSGEADDRPRIVPPFVIDGQHGTLALPLALGAEDIRPHLATGGYMLALYVSNALHHAVLAAPPWELPDAITAHVWLPPPIGNGKGSRAVVTFARLTAELWARIRTQLEDAEGKAARGEIPADAWRTVAARFTTLDECMMQVERANHDAARKLAAGVRSVAERNTNGITTAADHPAATR